MSEIVEISLTKGHDPYAQAGNDLPDPKPRHELDGERGRNLLSQLESWWAEALNAHSDNRAEQWLDADYYDSEQWRLEDAKVLEERGQAALTFPLIALMVDWVAGTERRTRIDWDVLPRKQTDVKAAFVKKEVLKFVSDVNGAGWERSKAFTDAATVGVGWTEECYNNDQFEEPITLRHVDWKSIWWDAFSRDNNLRDCRYVHRPKWLDLDYAIAQFPDRADALRKQTVSLFSQEQEQMELDATMPQVFYGRPGGIVQHAGLMSGMAVAGARQRVLVFETWFRKAVPSKTMLGDPEFNGQPYDEDDADMRAAVDAGSVSLVDGVTEEMWVAFWTPGALLKTMRSPYKHRRYPFTPIWCKRRHRDGLPYGLVRPARDSQDEYNKRRGKILFDLSTNLVLYESDAVDEGDESRMLDEAKRPDGEVRLSSGALEKGKFKIERNTEVAQSQLNLLAEAKNNIFEASGVTRENTGQSAGGDQSGRAILAKQQQGAVTTAALFDNYRQSIQNSGQKTLSNCEQFMSLPKVLRITGPDGALQWIEINQPQIDPATGEVIFNNDITRDEADFIIDQMDYRETVRMALSETLFELIGRLPGEVAVQLLDIAVDITDLPNKAELAKRIRAINGQLAPGQEDSPEAKAAQQKKQQDEQQAQDLAMADRGADVKLKLARADEASSKARQSGVAGKREALDTAGMLASMAPLAPAADRLYHGPAVQTEQPALPPPMQQATQPSQQSPQTVASQAPQTSLTR